MSELFRIADEVSVFRDGRYIGTHASADVTRDDIIRMMVGREITQMFPKEEVPIGEVVLSVRNLTCRASFTDISFDVRAGEILGVAGLVGSGRSNVAEALFGVTPATSGSIAINGAPILIDRPNTAIRNGMAFLTEDRKETGCFLVLGVQENMQVAVLQEHFVKGGVVAEGELSVACAGMSEKLRVKTPSMFERVREPVGRQPAESADRPLAADQPEDADSGRADARHRCRRQGGDPPPRHPACPAGRRRHHDFVGDAGGARHERPHHGDA